MGRAPLCIIPGEDTLVAFTTRDGLSIEVRSADKKRRFEKICDIPSASDKLINTICANPTSQKVIFSSGWDSKVSAWDISKEIGSPAFEPVQLPHVVNSIAFGESSIFAGGASGCLTKIKLS